MLNELHSLERGLAAFGVESVSRHADLSSLLKGDVFRIRLDARGDIADVELLPRKTRQEIWTLRDGKHNGFPGLKTAVGLLALSEEERADHDARWQAAKTAAERRLEIERLLRTFKIGDAASQWPKPGHRLRIAERLADLLTLDDDPNTTAVPATFRRFLSALALTPGLMERLLGALIQKVRVEDENWIDPVRKALLEPFPLAMDVACEQKFSRYAGDTRQIEAVSQALQGPVAAASNGDSDRHCALSGPSSKLLDGPFPQPTLPSLGISFLFSRNKDIPAMGRYGRSGPESLPVDAALVGRLSGALMAVTAEERRQKTWRLLPADAGDKQDLLIAYVTSDLNVPLITWLDDDDGEPEIEGDISGEANFEAAGRAILAFYEGLEGAGPHAEVRVLLFRAVDPANRKAIFDRHSTVRAVHDAANVWTRAMRNSPSWIRWPVFIAKKQVLAGPSARKPLSLTALSRKLYIRGGREATTAPGVSASEALALFLNEGDRALRARRVLRLLLDRHQPLLIGLAHASQRGSLRAFDPKATVRRDGLRSIAWMGALLFFLDRTKEIYMEDTGFKLGQLLSAMDAVHMGYCADVRGNQIPPTLIGNSVFAIAGRDPIRALDILSSRWKPYGAWARRSDQVRERASKMSSENVQWAIRHGLSQARLAKKLSEDVHEALGTMLNRPDEHFRAELLLGYVAGMKQEPKSSGENAKSASDNKEDQT